MPPPIDWMRRTWSQMPSLSAAEDSGATTCGALSTAITPISSNGPSVWMAAHVPRFARSILVRPSAVGTAMLPERSSATAIASDAERRVAAGDEQAAAEIGGEMRQGRERLRSCLACGHVLQDHRAVGQQRREIARHVGGAG